MPLKVELFLSVGFKGIWGSGLSISASLGVRDSNEASWTQVLDVVEYMSDATTRPLLLDADTGYGNFNNARRLVRKLEQRGVAGACLEDKLFPKTNSLLDGRAQPLADINEFALKIKACKGIEHFQFIFYFQALCWFWYIHTKPTVLINNVHCYLGTNRLVKVNISLPVVP